MKTQEEILNEMSSFISKSTEEREKEKRGLKKNIEDLRSDLASKCKLLQKNGEKLQEAETGLSAVKTDLSAAREKRQNAISLDQNTEAFDIQIRKLFADLREREVFYEDAVPGHKRRGEDLSNEIAFLEEELTEAQKMLIRFEVVPEIEFFNEDLTKAAARIPTIYRKMNEIGESFGPLASGANTVIISDREGIEVFPKLYLMGQIKPDDYWPNGKLRDILRFREMVREFQKESEAKK